MYWHSTELQVVMGEEMNDRLLTNRIATLTRLL